MKLDQVFGFYVQVLDHDENNYSFETTQKLLKGLANNSPEALPNLKLPTRFKRNFVKGIGASKPERFTYADLPLAGVPSIFGKAATMSARKLACALYYKEFGRSMTVGQQIIGGWHQIQNPLSANLLRFFNEHMMGFRQPTRSNIKQYGNRFAYRFALNPEEDFFGYAAQFGLGVFVWAIAARPDLDMSDSLIPPWRVGDPWI